MAEIVPESSPNGNKWAPERQRTLLLVAIVVLVGVAAFGLGRLSVMPSIEQEIIIHAPGDTQ